MSGTAIPGAIFGGDGIHITPQGRISAGLGDDAQLSGAIASVAVQRFHIPEDTALELEVNLMARLLTDAATSTAGATAAYTRVVTVSRVGSGAAEIVASTDLVAHEEANGTWAADVSMPAFTIVGGDSDTLAVSFEVANNSYEGADPEVQNILVRTNVVTKNQVGLSLPAEV